MSSIPAASGGLGGLFAGGMPKLRSANAGKGEIVTNLKKVLRRQLKIPLLLNQEHA